MPRRRYLFWCWRYSGGKKWVVNPSMTVLYVSLVSFPLVFACFLNTQSASPDRRFSLFRTVADLSSEFGL